MPLKWTAKVLVVLAVIVGVYFGATSGDCDRWFSALRLDRHATAKLRAERERQHARELQAADEARWRKPADRDPEQDDRVLTREDICAALREREASRQTREDKVQFQLKLLKLRCEEPQTTDE